MDFKTFSHLYDNPTGDGPIARLSRLDIKGLRAQLGISQSAMSEIYGIPKRTIENWESGTSKPPAYLVKLIAYIILTEKGVSEMSNASTLLEVTGQESGIVIYDNGNMLICNWASISGLPRMDPIGYAPMGLNEELIVEEGPEEIPDIGEWLDNHTHNILYDFNGDYPHWGCPGKLYTVSGVTVIAPDGWN